MRLKNVVTSFIQSNLRILLLRRSQKVGTYQGRWAGVSGYLELGENPLDRAKIEIQEELGLGSDQITFVRSGQPLRVLDEENDTVWIVHPFLFETQEQNVRLDWEHTEHEWVNPDNVRAYETVPRLKEAFERVRWDLVAVSPALSAAERTVNDLAQDRVHGASYLGRNSIEILAQVAKASDANPTAELFRDLLCFTVKLRRAQPSMATIRNLTGRLLHDVAQASPNLPSVHQVRESTLALAEKVLEDSTAAAEDASRNSAQLLPNQGIVLTHSYSGTVKRALELAAKSQHKLTVYVTESSPGLEGKQLAKDLIGLGIPVKLIADSAIHSIIPEVDLVLVGADSILADGSVVNKIGTSSLAKAAHERGVPCYAVCESTKFSCQDFLGEPVEVISALFDATPSKHVSGIVTEEDTVEPAKVEARIRKMLSQLYP